ncbi:hypothetical protein HA402_015829 [Bradysia odoriphaga]|nr:hypothetical protein HA402_015829 [Bradysia odoriphaga]
MYVPATTCGGNIVAESGIIRYNHTGYGNNTGCMWLIRSDIKSKIEVRLLEDSFSASSQYIKIHTLALDGEIGGIYPYSTVRHGEFKIRHFNGPLILVTFSTLNHWGPVNPTPSFTLLFRGCGPDISNPPTFTHHYREKIPGETEIVKYPEDGGIYPNNHIITYMALRPDRAIMSGLGEWKVKVTYHDIQPSAYCMFGDSLAFYNGACNSLPSVDEQEKFIWRFCERNSTKKHVVPARSTIYGDSAPDSIGILGVFQSNGYGYQRGNGFVFEW